MMREYFAALEAVQEQNPPRGPVGADNTALDVQASQAVVDTALEKIGEQQRTFATMEPTGAHVRATLPEGGLSTPVQQALATAVEHFRTRLGYEHRLLPTLEGFSRATKLQGTEIVLEGIVSMASTAWEAVVKAIKRVAALFCDLFDRLFSQKKKLENDYEALRKQTASFGKDAKVEPPHIHGTFSRYLFNDNTAFHHLNAHYVVKCCTSMVEKTYGASYEHALRGIFILFNNCFHMHDSEAVASEHAGWLKAKQTAIEELVTAIEKLGRTTELQFNEFGILRFQLPDTDTTDDGWVYFETEKCALNTIDVSDDYANKQVEPADKQTFVALLAIGQKLNNLKLANLLKDKVSGLYKLIAAEASSTLPDTMLADKIVYYKHLKSILNVFSDMIAKHETIMGLTSSAVKSFAQASFDAWSVRAGPMPHP